MSLGETSTYGQYYKIEVCHRANVCERSILTNRMFIIITGMITKIYSTLVDSKMTENHREKGVYFVSSQLWAEMEE